MACLFEYNDGKIVLASQSFEGLIQSLLYDSTGKLVRNLKDVTIDSLNFFNADVNIVNEVMTALESAEPTKGHTGVRDFLKGFLGLKQEVESSLEDSKGVVENADIILPIALDYVLYRALYGSALHNVVDTLQKKGNNSDEYKKALDALWKVLQSGKTRSSKWKDLGFSSVPTTIKFLENIPETESEFNTNYLYNSGGIVDKIMKELGKYGQNIKTEVRMEDSSAHSNRGLTGIADAIVWDNEGNVTIFDFKTTANPDISIKTRLELYLQLRIYKEMLIKKGIPSDKIKIKTFQIIDSLENGNQPSLSIEVFSPEDKFPTWAHLEFINKEGAALRILYPFTGKELTVDLQEAKKKRIESLVSPIISKLGISKIAVESQYNILQEKIKNNSPAFIQQIGDSEWKRGVNIVKWKKNGDIITGYDASGKERIKGTLLDIAEKEAKAIHELLHNNTRILADALHTLSYISILNFFKTRVDCLTSLLLALEPYLSNLYEYQRIAFLEDNYNIITMKNRADDTYSFIVLSEIKGLSHKRNGMNNILDPVFKDKSVLKKFKEAKDLPEPTAENLITLQAMVAILECRDILSNSPIKVDSILVVSTVNGTHTLGTNISNFTDAFKLLLYKAQNDPKSMESPEIYKDINDLWNNNIILLDAKEVLTKRIINRIFTFKLTNPDATLDGLDSITVENIVKNIEDILLSLRKVYPSDCFNGKSLIGRIYAGLQQIKRLYQTGEVFHKLYKHTNWGLTAAETLGSGIDILKYAQSRKYSFNGMIINGIALGLETSVSYSNPDKAILLYEQIFRLAARQITGELNDLAVTINLATKKFLAESNKSSFQITVVGSTTDAYESLFEQDNGKVSKNMQLKNPYSKFSELAPFLVEYAKEILWAINKLRIKNLLDDSVKHLSYKEFEKTEQHKYYVELINNNPEYLEMPLKLRNSTEGVIANIRNLFDPDENGEQTKSRVQKFCENIRDRWMQSIEPVLLTPDLASLMDLDINVSERDFTYHSPYNKQGENRITLLEKTPTNEWEKNLNILTLEYACAQFKEVYFLQVLHTVGNLLGEIDLMEVMTGQDLTKTKEALINRVKISIYNRNLVDDEFKTAASVIAGIKHVVSFTKLALRPATFMKEMILGVLRNSSTILLNNFVNDVPITFDHLLRAAGVVYTNGLFINNGFAPEDEKFGDFRLVAAINNLYRINDRDLNLLGESLSYDSHGILHWGSRMLYLNTTSPDWFNRMTILVAKMMADGTWEAHSLDADGRLLYDPFKDKRFKRFLSFYKEHPDLKNEPADEDYVMSKARYTLTVLQLQKEGYSNLTASDAEGYSVIPICYTSLEMDSVKEQIGMLYGYYSQEERTIIQKSIGWLIHTLFLTFLPGEIKKYFASGNFESSVGKVVHQTEPFTLKKLYYITNEAGLTEVVNEDELTTDLKTRPVLEFTKTPLEGLLISTLKTFSLVWHGDRENISKEQLDRTKLFFFNMLIWALLNALLISVGAALVKNKKDKSEDNRKLIDAAAASLRVTRAVASEMNVFNIMESALSTMGITGYDTLKEMIASTMNLITSDSGDYFSVLNLMGAINDLQIS